MDLYNFFSFTTKFVKVAVTSFKAGLEAGKEVVDMAKAREKYEAHVQSTARHHKH